MVVLGEIEPVTSLQQAYSKPDKSITSVHMKVKVLIQNQRGSVGTLTTTSILILESTSIEMVVV